MDWYMKRLNKVCLATAFTLALTGLAQAGTYKWVDKDGNVHYSQQPPAGSNYEKLKIKTPQPSSSPAPANQPVSPSTSATSGSGSKGSSAVIKEEMAKGKEIRDKNCEQAKKSLELYTVYRRVRDKDGNVVYLDDNERAKRIEESKQAIKDFCE